MNRIKLLHAKILILFVQTSNSNWSKNDSVNFKMVTYGLFRMGLQKMNIFRANKHFHTSFSLQIIGSSFIIKFLSNYSILPWNYYYYFKVSKICIDLSAPFSHISWLLIEYFRIIFKHCKYLINPSTIAN